MDLFTDQEREDLFVTAFEGGSSYWAEVSDPSPNSGSGDPASIGWFNHIQAGGVMHVYDCEEELGTVLLGTVTAESFNKAEALLVKDHRWVVGDVLNEQYDAESADIYFQLLVLGELTYG